MKFSKNKPSLQQLNSTKIDRYSTSVFMRFRIIKHALLPLRRIYVTAANVYNSFTAWETYLCALLYESYVNHAVLSMWQQYHCFELLFAFYTTSSWRAHCVLQKHQFLNFTSCSTLMHVFWTALLQCLTWHSGPERVKTWPKLISKYGDDFFECNNFCWPHIKWTFI